MDDEQKNAEPNEYHDVQLSDINPTNGNDEASITKLSTLTEPLQNGYEAPPKEESQPETNANGGDLISRRKRQQIASFQLQDKGIDHDVCVELQQEGELEDELDAKEKEKEEEENVQVSSPMMIDKPPEMRPYSVALEVLFKKKELKSKRKKMCLIALAILLTAFLIGGIVAVLIIFVGNTSEPAPEPVAIQGEFRISNRDYSDAYSNPKSAEYKELQQEFIAEMDTLYMNSTFKDLYINTEVTAFREGSVVVAFTVRLRRVFDENMAIDEDDSNEDDDTNEPDSDENQTSNMYRKARDFILISVDNGILGIFKGTVISLNLIPGEGRPVESVTIPTSTVTSSARATTTMTTTKVSSTATIAKVSTATTTKVSTVATTQNVSSTTSATITTPRHSTTSPTEKVTYPSEQPSSSNNMTYEDTLPDPCEPNPCQNGGNCTSFSRKPHCTCTDDYYGVNCEMDAMAFESSSYDYSSYDSLYTPFPSIVPRPGADMFDCEPIAIQECQDLLPYNMTTAPNPHGMGNTMADLSTQYALLSAYINAQCHAEGPRVLCSLLHTSCTPDTVNLFMAFLHTYIPCRSLCLEVGGACSSGGPMDIDELCNALPESADEAICFRSPDATGPPSCTPEVCQNGGSCFEMMNRTMCRCHEGFAGDRCEVESIDPCLSNPCGNQGRCQTETPSLPGIPLLYMCICQAGYYGQHCQYHDVTNMDLVDTPDLGLSACGAEILIPECADIVPYNISYSAAVSGDQYKLVDWPSILAQAQQCHQDATVFICSRMQNKCTYEGPISPCFSLCERVSASCDIASFALPSVDCSTYSDSLNHLDCFDTTYAL